MTVIAQPHVGLRAQLARRLAICVVLAGIIFGGAAVLWLAGDQVSAVFVGVGGVLWIWRIILPVIERQRLYRWVLSADDHKAPPAPRQPDPALALVAGETLVLARSPRAHVFVMLPLNVVYALAGVFTGALAGMGNRLPSQNSGLAEAIMPQRITFDALGITLRAGWRGEQRALWQYIVGIWEERNQTTKARRIHLLTAESALVISLFANRALCKTQPDETAYQHELQRLLATLSAQSHLPLRIKPGAV